MSMILGWLLKTAVGRIIGLAVGGVVLSGILYAGCQVKGCMNAREEVKQYQRADEIRKEDPKVDKKIEEHQKKVEEAVSPDDFKHGFDELRQYGADD